MTHTDDGIHFVCRDKHGRWYHTTTPELYVSPAEVRAARRDCERAKYPLPEYDVDTGLYYWPPDRDDQYTEVEIAADMQMLGMDVESLEVANILARAQRIANAL
ncbi:MAG TPA: hypothetical protein PJ982_03635 [Lacipirellulaceae bacterium]|nr:hypothetical protein [Lacipirellulaceae bacterium]